VEVHRELRREVAGRRQASAGRETSRRDGETDLPRDLQAEGLAVVRVDAQTQDVPPIE
jgi:hypothetical protein